MAGADFDVPDSCGRHLMEGEMNEQQNELEERTASVLLKIKSHCTKDEFSLLCWHCGMRTNDFETMPTKETA